MKTKTRTAKSLRKEIHLLLDQVDDCELLRKIRRKIRKESKPLKFDDLPDILKQKIERGLQDIAAGRVHSHEEVVKELFGDE